MVSSVVEKSVIEYLLCTHALHFQHLLLQANQKNYDTHIISSLDVFYFWIIIYFCIIQLSILGDVPLLLSTPISSANFSNILPPGLVITILAYLANRLVVGPSDKHKLNLLIRDNAACIIQNAWRRFQDYINFSKLKLIPYGRWV